ncbi:hypothetical protein RN001_003854 [Aquatica leii]|uniref:DNA-directed RNA polymerases I and III subunit RPAC2 n=1 Tax=Aquatica leii TaxID=1421715 RepID=A0AAN7QPB6_9COLE|nr:hypothetical protein RN001_003854 [Aquatica leii]
MPIAQLAGTDPAEEKSKTFVFHDEGHTMGNALRYVISSYDDVEFCGYTVPHPAESKMHLRIQMRNGRAIDALRRALKDLVKLCDHTIETFNEQLISFQTDQLST